MDSSFKFEIIKKKLISFARALRILSYHLIQAVWSNYIFFVNPQRPGIFWTIKEEGCPESFYTWGLKLYESIVRKVGVVRSFFSVLVKTHKGGF